MTVRPAAETIAILRRTLEQVETEVDSLSDTAAVDDLKSIVRRRIAELEAEVARAGHRDRSDVA